MARRHILRLTTACLLTEGRAAMDTIFVGQQGRLSGAVTEQRIAIRTLRS